MVSTSPNCRGPERYLIVGDPRDQRFERLIEILDAQIDRLATT
jgi:hypothetical protein